MEWKSNVPRIPTLRSKRDEDLAAIGDDLIHEALGSPTDGRGKTTGGLGERAFFRTDLKHAEKFEHMGFTAEQTHYAPETMEMTLGAVLAVVRRAALTDREVDVVVRHNEGERLSTIAREMDVALEAVADAYERSMAALGRCVSQSPYFGLSDAYREDTERTGRHHLGQIEFRRRSAR